jgi:hypothetical protein
VLGSTVGGHLKLPAGGQWLPAAATTECGRPEAMVFDDVDHGPGVRGDPQSPVSARCIPVAA